MNELKKHYPLLLIVAILLSIKFILIPLTEWQQRTVNEQKLQLRKLTKSLELLANKNDIVEAYEHLNGEMNKLKPLFYTEEAQTNFQLEQQKIIETKLARHNLTSKRLGWLPTYEQSNEEVSKIQLEYSFEGDGENVIAYLIELSENKELLAIEKINLSFRGQRPGQLGIISVFAKRNFYVLSQKGS